MNSQTVSGSVRKLILCVSLFPSFVWAESGDEVEFDSSLLILTDKNAVSISRFEKGASTLPGSYPADVYINDRLSGNFTINIRENDLKKTAPCLTPDQIKLLGLDASQLSAATREKMDQADACIDISEGMQDVRLDFDEGAERLDITVPQSVAADPARGSVDPSLWDEGITAGLLGYNINGFQSYNGSTTTSSLFGDIKSGINAGQWYFRHNGTFSGDRETRIKYDSVNSYVQRDITPLKSTLLLGEVNTRGQFFNTVPFKGALLQSDERMLPSSLRGYAPEVYGNARTNARVTIRQNNVVIYEKTVTPGAFIINDLYPTGFGGNLEVTVQEADGSVQTYMVPFASVNQLLRPGQYRYEIAAGKVNQIQAFEKENFFQFTLQHGVNNFLTGYGGTQFVEGYLAAGGGIAFNTPAGALSFDAINSQATPPGHDNTLSGQRYKATYTEYLPQSRTNISLSLYRFTENYSELSSAAQLPRNDDSSDFKEDFSRPKVRTSVTVSQGLAQNYGSFYVSGYAQNYWKNNGTDLQYQVGYNNVYRQISYSVSAGRVRNGSGKADTNLYLSLSIPLGSQSSGHSPTLMTSLTRTGNATGTLASVSGTAGEDDQLSYGVSGSHYSNGAGSSASLNGVYRTSYTSLNGSYTEGKGYRTFGGGITGTVVAYKGGLVFSPYAGENMAIVEAEGAQGAQVGNYKSSRIDRWGRALVPYLNPYEMNSISIDPRDTSEDVEIQSSSLNVAPRSGAVSLLSFKTRTGYPIFLKAVLPDGSPLPFGAEVFDEENNNVGSVGQMGLIYALVKKETGTLRVALEESGFSCGINYGVGPKSGSADPQICR